MIHVAKRGDEEIEARRLSRRGFLGMLIGGTASLAVPTKSYFFFGNVLRSPAPIPPWILAMASPLAFYAYLNYPMILTKS